MQAHNHNYQPSFPISYIEQINTHIVTDRGNAGYNDREGSIFVVAGMGGRNLCDLKSKTAFMVTQFEEYGILEVKITNGNGVGTKLTGTFYANDEIRYKTPFRSQNKIGSDLFCSKILSIAIMAYLAVSHLIIA